MNIGFATPDLLLKKSLALTAWLRMYSNREPWGVLVPERVISSICPPALRPYSALPPSVTTRNSSTESVLLAVSVRPNRGAVASLMSMPSRVLLLLPPPEAVDMRKTGVGTGVGAVLRNLHAG